MDFGARHHHGFHWGIGKLENAMNEFFFGFVEDAFSRAFTDQRLDLIDGDKTGASGFFAAK